jgi:RecQ mediated genome instability protein
MNSHSVHVFCRPSDSTRYLAPACSGAQHAVAMELLLCPSLSADLPAGCKVAVDNPVVRNGVLLLMGNVSVLGGGVTLLEEARQRLIAHWNQPLGHNLLTARVRDLVSSLERSHVWFERGGCITSAGEGGGTWLQTLQRASQMLGHAWWQT